MWALRWSVPGQTRLRLLRVDGVAVETAREVQGYAAQDEVRMGMGNVKSRRRRERSRPGELAAGLVRIWCGGEGTGIAIRVCGDACEQIVLP